MNTSENIRLVMIGLLFVAGWFVVIANIRLISQIILRKKTRRLSKVVWPALGLLLIFSIFDAFYIEPNWIQVTHHQIKTPKLAAGSKVRIAHLSDIHLTDVGVREIKAINLITMEKPDVIFLTGDYTVIKDERTIKGLGQIIKRLSKIAPTYAVEGNWDFEEDMLAIKQNGAIIPSKWSKIKCRNAEIAISNTHWFGADIPAVPGNMKNLYKVVLCHIPRLLESASERKIDLVLSGHTHGGQVRIPVFGAVLPDRRLVGKYQAGLYKKDGTYMNVNRGLGMEGGNAPKVRFCCRPEVTIIDISGK